MTKSEYLASLEPYGGDCTFCGGKNHPYMIQFQMWNKLFPRRQYPQSSWRKVDGELKVSRGTYCCIPCLEVKLNRPLNEDDFIDAPINKGWGIDAKLYCSLPGDF